jgi:hypothetical protein
MSIYESILKDHKNLKQMVHTLIAVEDRDAARAHELAVEIYDYLIPHSRSEEMLFYSPLISVCDAKDIANKNYREHVEAEDLLRILQLRMDIDSNWKDISHRLKRIIDDQANRDEEVLFKLGKTNLSEEEADALGEAFAKMKSAIQKKGFSKENFDAVMAELPPPLVERFYH